MKPFLIALFLFFLCLSQAKTQPSVVDSCRGDTKFDPGKEYSKFILLNGIKKYKWDNETINCHMNMAVDERIKRRHALRNGIIKAAAGLIITEVGLIFLLQSDLELYPEVLAGGSIAMGVGVCVAATSVFSFFNMPKHKKKYREHMYFLRNHFEGK